jgi:hypothetical protein
MIQDAKRKLKSEIIIEKESEKDLNRSTRLKVNKRNSRQNI